MNTRVLTVLGLATVVAVLLTFGLVERSEDSAAVSGAEPLLPGLADRVNDIDALQIIDPAGETVATLHRERERWRLREKHDYEADFARIHGLLRDLAQARRLEAKTRNPEWYGRLGVAELGEADGSGAAIRFPDSAISGLIVGKRDPAAIGRYVRVEDESRAWLVGRDLDLPTDRMEWLERAIMDIPAADIHEVSVRHPDGDEVELRPGDEEGSVWVMLDPPADREVKQGWQLQQTANALATLNMEDVRPHEAGSVADDAVETVYRTRDGMVFRARSWSDEEGNWVHFRVSEAESRESPADASGSSGTQSEHREIDIVAVDGRLSPWQFGLSGDRFEGFRPTTESLLVASEESAD